MKLLLFLIIFICFSAKSFSAEYVYILNDKCINDLYYAAEEFFKDSKIKPLRDSRGIVLRLYIEDVFNEYNNPRISLYKEFELFLAKIENPAIIEVHLGNFRNEEFVNLKKWEISTIMANEIEAIITEPAGLVDQNRINSIGYGEFLPAKNTSNNGGKGSNRIDIIILCNISGE